MFFNIRGVGVGVGVKWTKSPGSSGILEATWFPSVPVCESWSGWACGHDSCSFSKHKRHVGLGLLTDQLGWLMWKSDQCREHLPVALVVYGIGEMLPFRGKVLCSADNALPGKPQTTRNKIDVSTNN